MAVPHVWTHAQQFRLQEGEGRRSPGEVVPGVVPGAGALAQHGSCPGSPSIFGALCMAADGRRGMLEAKVHPEVGVSLAGACRIPHLYRCAVLTVPVKTAGFLLAAGPSCCWSRVHHGEWSISPKHWPWPSVQAWLAVTTCPGWPVTWVWLKAEPHPGSDKVLLNTLAVRGQGATAADAGLLCLPDVYVCWYIDVFIYLMYICIFRYFYIYIKK